MLTNYYGKKVISERRGESGGVSHFHTIPIKQQKCEITPLLKYSFLYKNLICKINILNFYLIL
tara:strand:- start:9550 stop:9738 length:189 start_codon:yes stop_codon:yes gene_type:complete